MASVVSTVILVACGRRENHDASRPVNAPSQWVWGRYATYVRGFSVKHTVTGYAIHHAMSVLWAVLFERIRPRNEAPGGVAAAAGATAAIAYIVDYKIVPARVSPGFDVALSRRCLFATYAGFALALAGTVLLRRISR
jgi:hypothetical protein